ncbi:polysaccharide biosynthesis/export family protein [Paracidobacterium acidisoli]|nr:polysaccharide biosynthesis/export family protein [Paracidobacterium acidisoli]MBT9330415.1 polysaccharide export protein [Paracidobacterium acidisoli]
MVRNKRHPLTLAALALLITGLAVSAVAQDQQAAPAPAASEQTAPAISIGPGDLLNVMVFDIPELSGTSRVSQNGVINLPVLGLVNISGLNTSEAALEIETQLKQHGLVLDPHVTVSIAEYASQGATMTGEIHSPGIYPTLGSRRLLDMISLAGGLSPTAGKLVTIIHRNDPQHPEDVDLAEKASGLSSQKNPIILPGDTVVVNKAGIIYILGDVEHPGGFLVDNNEHLTLMQVLSLAGGTTNTSALSRTMLIRKVPSGREEIKLDLKHVYFGTQADLKVDDGDILFVPSSFGKTLAYRGIEATVTAAQQISAYKAAQ